MRRSIETVSIIGAGALGAVYAALLYDMDPGCVTFLAGGERAERLAREGVIVNGKTRHISVVAPEERAAPADLVMVAVKYQHLDDAIRDMKNRVGAETLIISVMNGIESEERIGAVYGMDRVLYAVSLGIDALRDANSVIYTTQGKLFIGEAANPVLTERVRRVQALFEKAGIVYETPPDMLRILWWKFMINVGINQASAVLRAPYALFQTAGEARELMGAAMREVVRLAVKTGVDLSEADIEGFDPFLLRLNPQGKTSMLQDVEAGRKTEVEMFAGRVIEMGRRYGVPTPVNQSLFAQIRKIESDGGAD
ncbi:MAG: 2-dehydropantoate 2-reductase [Syntrophus sp. (in: bacteria)]|nr:2-dehydropantoate 2-reductase [Syntrophus sp. (in: bacteria)]